MSDFAASVLMALFLGSTGALQGQRGLCVATAVLAALVVVETRACSSDLFDTALGGLLGGYVGDLAAKRHPHHGRIFACQFSVAVGIPFSLLILKVWEPHVIALSLIDSVS